MTKFSSLLAGIALAATCATAGVATAQTTALDWTKADCNSGTSHHLFSELDSGFVVIQEFVMLGGCQPCITAGNVLKTIYNDYQATNPGKVRIYQTAFNNSGTCAQMTSWATAANFGHATQFSMGTSEVAYYGGMGMPTIVVLGGGSQRKVYFNEQGSISSASTQQMVKDAINLAMAEAQATTAIAPGAFSVYPSPAVAGGTLRVSIAEGSIASVQVLSITGQVVSATSIQGGASVATLAVPQVAAGVYMLRITDAEGKIGTQKLVIE